MDQEVKSIHSVFVDKTCHDILDQTAYALIKIMAIDTCYHYWKSNGWVKDERKTPSQIDICDSQENVCGPVNVAVNSKLDQITGTHTLLPKRWPVIYFSIILKYEHPLTNSLTYRGWTGVATAAARFLAGHGFKALLLMTIFWSDTHGLEHKSRNLGRARPGLFLQECIVWMSLFNWVSQTSSADTQTWMVHRRW